MTGPPDRDEQVIDEALAWQQQLAGDDADWERFTDWLEADPQHRRIFDEITLVDRTVDDRAEDLRKLLAARDESGGARPRQRRQYLVGSIAAALAVAIAVPALWPGPADTVYATGPGESRQVALAGGTAVDLAPSSRLIVDGANPNTLRLANGEAFFAVRHDPRRQLSIRAGAYTITDIGTKFAVGLGEGGIRMGVAEGHVAVAGGTAAATRLSAGEQLIVMADGTARKSVVAAQDIGSWRHGRLVYKDAPLSIVVADIARYSGRDISIGPEIKNRRFSGVLTVGDGSDLLANLAKLMALDWREVGGRLRIGTAPAR